MKQPLFFRPNSDEFYPAWKDVKLGDLAIIRKGFTPSTENRSFWEGDIPWLSITGFNEKYLKEGTKFISSQALGTKKLFPAGSLVMSFKLTLGKLGILSKPMMTNEAICYLDWKDDSIDNEFAFYALSSIDLTPYANQAAAGLTLNDSSLNSIRIKLPSLPEQQRIAEFFSALDERITLTADKVKLLKEQKAGYLQRVFSGDMAFTDDNGNPYPEWEEKKLGDIAEIIGGGTPSTGEPSFWDGDINWFSPTDVGKSKYLTKSARKITEAGLKNSSAKIHPVGTVLLTTRASLGRMGILRSEAATNQGFQSLLPRDNTISEFLYYLQPQIETYCEVKASGSTFKEISGKEIAKMPVKLPSLPEQERIAEFFSALDENIALNERKLVLLKEQKKGYLQGIFG
jgi:type I restriction enzyme S subunit